jgi:uncharacterized protein
MNNADRNPLTESPDSVNFESGGNFFGRLSNSPVGVRVAPFVIFALLTILQSEFGESAQYWIYALKTIVAAGLLWLWRPKIPEMKWTFSWESIVAGIVIFIAWVGLDGHYPMLKREGSFNPFQAFGHGSSLGLTFVAIRILGSSLIVPMLEEVFYRSFLYRYFIRTQFGKIPLNRFDLRSFLLLGAIFGIGHFEWLPGVLCAFAFQALVYRKNRLGDAISAHAITNLLLGIWVICRDAYYFW